MGERVSSKWRVLQLKDVRQDCRGRLRHDLMVCMRRASYRQPVDRMVKMQDNSLRQKTSTEMVSNERAVVMRRPAVGITAGLGVISACLLVATARGERQPQQGEEVRRRQQGMTDKKWLLLYNSKTLEWEDVRRALRMGGHTLEIATPASRPTSASQIGAPRGPVTGAGRGSWLNLDQRGNIIVHVVGRRDRTPCPGCAAGTVGGLGGCGKQSADCRSAKPCRKVRVDIRNRFFVAERLRCCARFGFKHF